MSDSIDKELLGIFANSFYLTNYEFTQKTDPASRGATTSGSQDEDFDPRTLKYTKHINHVVISTKDSPNVF